MKKKPNIKGITNEFKLNIKLSFISFIANYLFFGDGFLFNRLRAHWYSWFFNINKKGLIGKNVKFYAGKGRGIKDIYIGPGVYIYRETEILAPFMIGDGSYISNNSLISNTKIGKNCAIGPRVILGPANHEIGPPDKRAGKAVFLPCIIKDGVWVGARSVIFGGVTVGRGSIVAAGAVVTKDVPPNTMVGGVPARVVKKLKNTNP
ncbi:MAG: acyltransferase [Promethearchaeota archaeon]|jgi:maltose O-acetyltransferase